MAETNPIIIVDEEVWKSSKILNPNAFHQNTQSNVEACVDKLALLHFSIQLIEREIKTDLKKFINEYDIWTR